MDFLAVKFITEKFFYWKNMKYSNEIKFKLIVVLSEVPREKTIIFFDMSLYYEFWALFKGTGINYTQDFW